MTQVTPDQFSEAAKDVGDTVSVWVGPGLDKTLVPVGDLLQQAASTIEFLLCAIADAPEGDTETGDCSFCDGSPMQEPPHETDCAWERARLWWEQRERAKKARGRG